MWSCDNGCGDGDNGVCGDCDNGCGDGDNGCGDGDNFCGGGDNGGCGAVIMVVVMVIMVMMVGVVVVNNNISVEDSKRYLVINIQIITIASDLAIFLSPEKKVFLNSCISNKKKGLSEKDLLLNFTFRVFYERIVKHHN